MSAIPQLWVPGERWRDALARKRHWLRRLRSPWANFSAGQEYLDSTTGKAVVSASGQQEMDSGSGNGCCLYQARKCSDGTLAGVYVKKSQFPSYPTTFYYWNGSQCLYVQSSDSAPCNSTPIDTIVTTYASCTACTNAHGGCSITPSGLLTSYTVGGFAGLANSCGCAAATTQPSWTGAVYQVTSNKWTATPPGGNLALELNGWLIVTPYTYVAFITGASCRWLLVIGCSSGGGNWIGTKTTGNDPTGTYNFVASDPIGGTSCDTGPATMSVS